MAMTQSLAAAAAILLLPLAACQSGAPAAGDAGAGRQSPPTGATIAATAKSATVATTDFAPFRSLEFARAVFRLSEGESVAISRGGSFSFSCLLNEQSMQGWNPPRMQPAPLDIERGFVASLTAAGYRVAGGSDELFGRSRGASGDLLVGAIVTDVDMALCRRYSLLHKKVLGYIGDATITVEWQVLSRASDSLVLKTTTTASASVEEEDVSPHGVPLLLTRAFGAAAKALAADSRLRELASTGPTLAAASPPGPDARLEIRGAAARARPIASNSAEIAGSTFVVALGNGHGSGFLISRDGYALTNSHVVRGLAQVNVVLADGRRATADVLREDPRRDVALLKLPPQPATGLAVRREPAKLTEEVFAIGAPGGSGNAQSVTRGIIGSRRVDAATGLAFLQADAAILPGSSGGPLVDRHGNVVGIAVARLGVRDRGAATPLNYFVPMDEALEALNIDLK